MRFSENARLIAQDAAAYARYAAPSARARPGWRRRIGILLTPPLMCAALHRLAHWHWRCGMPRRARALAYLNYVLHKAAISPASRIGGGLYIPHTVGIVFRGEAGARLVLYGLAVVEGARLGDDVTIGVHAVVLGPATLGNGAKVGPRAVASGDVAPNTAVLSRAFARTARLSRVPA